MGTSFPGCSSARSPQWPHPKKATPPSWSPLPTLPPGKPLPVQVSSADLQQVKTLPTSQNSGLLIPSLVAFQHIFTACPVGLRTNSRTLVGIFPGVPWSVWAGPHSLTSLVLPGTLTEGPPGTQTGCYIHVPLRASPIGTEQ